VIVQEIKLAASLIADSQALAIIEAARENLSKTRFERLRKRLTSPNTGQELAYMQALGQYVLRKMNLKRMKKHLRKRLTSLSTDQELTYMQARRVGISPGAHFFSKCQITTEMKHFREQMDKIEFQ
jgi:hypothetical protein